MRKKILVLFVLSAFIVPSFSQIFHKNKGVSKSVGTVSNGKLVNAYKVNRKGHNYKFFSLFDYYILGRCYVHSDVYNIVNECYKNLEKVYPDYTFMLMECSKKKGGRLFPHRTHQNGTSIDFMTPLLKNREQYTLFDHIGIWRYVMNFNNKGEYKGNKKVILETNLKDEIFTSKYGPELKNSGIYFVKNLSPKINALHDDHYHIDFMKL